MRDNEGSGPLCRKHWDTFDSCRGCVKEEVELAARVAGMREAAEIVEGLRWIDGIPSDLSRARDKILARADEIEKGEEETKP